MDNEEPVESYLGRVRDYLRVIVMSGIRLLPEKDRVDILSGFGEYCPKCGGELDQNLVCHVCNVE